jgi:hypothetical protein
VGKLQLLGVAVMASQHHLMTAGFLSEQANMAVQ